MTLPGPIRFVMSSQSHVHLANGTAPTDGGHSVLSARSRIFKWRFTCGSQGSRIRETNLSRPIQVTRFQAALFSSNSFVGCLGLRPIQVTGLTFGRFGNLCANLTLPSLGILRTDLQLPWFFWSLHVSTKDSELSNLSCLGRRHGFATSELPNDGKL